jgi:hypothetical protein
MLQVQIGLERVPERHLQVLKYPERARVAQVLDRGMLCSYSVREVPGLDRLTSGLRRTTGAPIMRPPSTEPKGAQRKEGDFNQIAKDGPVLVLADRCTGRMFGHSHLLKGWRRKIREAPAAPEQPSLGACRPPIGKGGAAG